MEQLEFLVVIYAASCLLNLWYPYKLCFQSLIEYKQF